MILTVVVLALSLGLCTADFRQETPLFRQFLDKYKKQYTSTKEHNLRFWIFYKNSLLWDKANRDFRGGTARYGITPFADLTEEEFAHTYLNKVLSEQEVHKIRDMLPPAEDVDTTDVPDNVDWREKNAVTAVKNQGACGSCWAFSTTGNVEGQYAIKTGNLTSLSEQELVDCDKVDEGCNGGLPSQAYDEITRLGGLELESDYPYTGRGQTCTFDKSKARVQVTGGIQLPTDEEKIAAWVAQNGPVSIGINAFMMQFYIGGIAHPWKILCRPANLDHGVLITGYGVEDEVPYWTIKNSWGTVWGEKGYYRLFRGSNACGVNEMVTSSTL